MAHGLQSTSIDTGGFYVRGGSAPRALDRVGSALVGHYVLFAEAPPGEPGTHQIEVELSNRRGTVFARRSYVD